MRCQKKICDEIKKIIFMEYRSQYFPHAKRTTQLFSAGSIDFELGKKVVPGSTRFDTCKM